MLNMFEGDYFVLLHSSTHSYLMQGGCTLRPYMTDLMKPIVDALLDGASITKRQVAVATLGQVVESTG